MKLEDLRIGEKVLVNVLDKLDVPGKIVGLLKGLHKKGLEDSVIVSILIKPFGRLSFHPSNIKLKK